MRFEWDPAKASTNVDLHGVTFEEATTVFGDALARTIYDPEHSESEHRFVTIGRSESQTLLVVVHTERGEAIRIISARRGSRREKKSYEAAEEDDR